MSPWQGAHDPRISLLRAVPCPSLCHQVGALPMPVSPHRATMALAQPSPWCVMCQEWPSSVGRPVSPHCHPPTREPRVTPVRPAGIPLPGGWPPQWHSSYSLCKWHRPTVTRGYTWNCQRNRKFFQEKFLGAKPICFKSPALGFPPWFCRCSHPKPNPFREPAAPGK